MTEERRPPREAERLYEAPDLVVKVLSASTRDLDLGIKRTIYERAGLAELWLVDTDAETVLVFRRSSPAATFFDGALEQRSGDALASPLLPDLSLSVPELFAR